MKAVSSANSLTPPRPNCALCSLLHFTATYLGCTNHSISWYTVLIQFCLLSLCGKLVWPLLSSFVLFFIQMVVTRKGIIHWNLGYCKQSDIGTMYWTVMSIHHRLKSGLEIVLAQYWRICQSCRPAESDFGTAMRKSSARDESRNSERNTRGWKEMGHQPCRSISLEFWIYLAWQCGSDIDSILQLFCVHTHVAHLQEERTEEGAKKKV